MTQTTRKAGAIILSKDQDQSIALLHRAKQNDWSFPKGHVDEGENGEQTMLREIKEETGLTVEIIKKLPDLEYHNNDGSPVSLQMFLVKSTDDNNLKTEFEGDTIAWTPFSEVTEVLSYDNLKMYFSSIVDQFDSQR